MISKLQRLGASEFVALNGGPQFKFTEAISFVVNCETQQEGQIVPSVLVKLLQDKDPLRDSQSTTSMPQKQAPDG
jgi:hypothetical protein